MSTAFDPYHKWLGIPPRDQPPNHYRLLGIDPFESDRDVISNAADQRMAHLRMLQAGEQSDACQRLLNEISRARLSLLDAEKKAQYDAALRDVPVENEAQDDTTLSDDEHLELDEAPTQEGPPQDWYAATQYYAAILKSQEPRGPDSASDSATPERLLSGDGGSSEATGATPLPPMPESVNLDKGARRRESASLREELAPDLEVAAAGRVQPTSVAWPIRSSRGRPWRSPLLQALILLGVLVIALATTDAVLTRRQIQEAHERDYAKTEKETPLPATTTGEPPGTPKAPVVQEPKEESPRVGTLPEVPVRLDTSVAHGTDKAEERSAAASAVEQAEDLNQRGMRHCREGNLDVAIFCLTKAIGLNRTYGRAYHNRGVVSILKGSLDEAIADFNEAIQLNPNDALPQAHRGLAYEIKGEKAKAEASYTRAEQLGMRIDRARVAFLVANPPGQIRLRSEEGSLYGTRDKTILDLELEYYRRRAAAKSAQDAQ